MLPSRNEDNELKRVLAYRQLKLSPERQAEIFTRYQQHTTTLALPDGAAQNNLMMPGGFPRCRAAAPPRRRAAAPPRSR